MQYREPSPELCDDLRDGMREEREALEGGDVCIIMADSHSCMAETKTAL